MDIDSRSYVRSLIEPKTDRHQQQRNEKNPFTAPNQDRKNNQPHEKIYDEMMARVIQHEMDHLDGKLIVDYAGIKEKIKLRAQLKELERKQKGKE